MWVHHPFSFLIWYSNYTQALCYLCWPLLTFIDYFITANYLLIAFGTMATCTRRWAGVSSPHALLFASIVDKTLPWFAIALGVIVLVVFSVL